jgi:anti-sigma regulatory factor (Ser/Thr protein kinase)
MTVTSQLPKQPGAAAIARRVLDEFDGRIDPAKLETARLLVTEVVTNAVRHVQREGPIDLCLALSEDALRVEVVDPGEGFVPRRRGPDSPLDGNWGLHFLEVLSDRWGIESDERTRVWFELTRAAA